jgi:NAD(P)H-nitrite reductase large subunit
MSTKLKLLAVDVARISDSVAITPGAKNYSDSDISGDKYKSLVVSEDGKTLPGIHKLRRLYRFGATVAGFRTE